MALPTLVTRSSAGHLDLLPQGTGHGLQLAHAAIRDTITAAHGVVDTCAHLLALTCSLPILYCTCCPERTPNLVAWRWGLGTQALVLGGYGTLLPTLGLLAPTVIVICVPILGAHGPVGPITGDTVTGAVGTATARQAHSIELARLRALILRLTLARTHFLEEQTPDDPSAAHDAVIFVSDPIIPAHK